LKTKRKWVDKTKTILNGIGCEFVDWTELSQDGVQPQSFHSEAIEPAHVKARDVS
jgi:hypothetical protein